MLEINLVLIATAIGVVTSIWKFSNSISKFGHSVDELRRSMKASVEDRKELRETLNIHAITIREIETQYKNIKENLDEIKRKVS